MKTNCKEVFVLRRSLLAAAVAMALPGGVVLADDEVQELISPDKSEISVRMENLNKVNPAFRRFNGMNHTGINGSVDVDIVRRRDDGLWIKFQASDLGLKTQEFGVTAEQQGDWKLMFQHDEIVRYAPYTLKTKVGGVGTASLTLNQDFRSSGGLGTESDLKLERTSNSVSGHKFLSDAMRFNFSFKSEDKSGAIMGSSIGSTWNGAVTGFNYGTMFFSPQPENYNHKQLEWTLDYFTKKFQVSGGYYGSFFNNAKSALNITPGINSMPTVPCSAATCVTAVAAGAYADPWLSLAPDNKSQQWFASGAYNFTDKTRGTFKASYARNDQNDTFIPAYGAITPRVGTPISANYNQVNPPGVPYASGITNRSLQGRVDTITYFGQLTSRLTNAVDLLGSWRYEDRKDKTPQRFYLDSQASAEYPNGLQNALESHKVNRGKFEVGYRISPEYRLTGGLDYDTKKTPGAMRDSIEELTYRADLRKSMGESINGTLSVGHSDRTGGNWHLHSGTPAAGSTTFSTASGVAAPLQFVDRKRDKIKAMLEWNPVDPVSTQFFIEHSRDSYPFNPPSGNRRMGMTGGTSDLYGADLSYKINSRWTSNAFYSYNLTKTHQNELYTPRINAADQACTGVTVTTSCSPWEADLKLKGMVFGAGVKGSVSKWDMGADYIYSRDATRYDITFNPSYPTAAGSSVPSGAGVLPETVYVLNRLRLQGTYAYSKATKVRLDYVYDLRKIDDYTWTNWTFSDGTQVIVNPTQRTQVIGITLIQQM